MESGGIVRGRKQGFSKVKAVKATARATVGRPPVERVIEDPKRRKTESPRFRETLKELLPSKQEQEEIR